MHNFKKLGKIEKFFLKLSDKKQYKLYKVKLAEHIRAADMTEFAKTDRGFSKELIAEKVKSSKGLSFLHSGNAGDIIYALPTLKTIAELFNIKVTLYLQLHQPMSYNNGTHPLGNVMMNEKMAELLISLVATQPYMQACEIHNGQEIDISLDMAREMGVLQDRGSIPRWYGYITGINAELYKPWLSIKPNPAYNDVLVVARSERYRNSYVDYSFLNKYPKKVFIGVKAEWEDFKKHVPDIEWLQVSNFLEMAQIIAGCKVFLGNQSLPFSIAEGLKVPRILETYIDVPNVIPEGPNGYDFYFQKHLESLIEGLVELSSFI